MFFFNLSLGEFLVLFSAASAAVVALYMLDRSRRAVVVATLRFWSGADRPVESTRRRRIKQWPSLILQLVSIACLLLALSQLRLGSRDESSRDHVLVMDTSSWMGARAGGTTLIEQARTQALGYLRAIPSTDRLLVIHADALATPVTSFETNRRKLEQAIRGAQPGDSALDLQQALDFARRVQARSAARPGEIVYAGAGRITAREGEFQAPANLRILPVKGAPQNTGLRRIGLRRSQAEQEIWNIFVSVRNYGNREQNVDLALQFAGAPAGTRTLRIRPGADEEAAFEYRTRAAGPLDIRIRAGQDAFAQDDRALIDLPGLPTVPVTVCTDQPQTLRPLVESNPNVKATFLATAQCAAAPEAGIAIFDRFVPGGAVNVNALYIEPPAGRSPVPVSQTVTNVMLERWKGTHALGAGLRAQDFRLESAQAFRPGTGDQVIGETAAGPAMVAKEGATRAVIMGFHPARSPLRFELTTPLLFANVLRWLAPESFRHSEMFAASAGSVTVTLDSEADAARTKVLTADQQELPFSVQGKTLRFFSGRPGTVRVVTGDREQIHSLAIPAVPDEVWNVPATVRRGVPRAREAFSSSRDIWYWLAILGGLGLLLEWLWFSPAGTGVPKAILRRFRPRDAVAPARLRRAS